MLKNVKSMFYLLAVSCFVLAFSTGCNTEGQLAKAASSGDVLAQYDLAEYYRNLDVPQKTKSFEWMKRAAQSRYIPAMKDLAHFYLIGYGTEVNYPEASNWLQRYYEHHQDSEEALKNARDILLGASSRADVVAGFALYKITIMLENQEGDGDEEIATAAASEVTIHTKKVFNWLIASRSYVDAKKLIDYVEKCIAEYPESFSQDNRNSVALLRKQLDKYLDEAN